MSLSPNHIVTKWEWPRLFREAYIKSFNKENITKGFEVSGIYPFHPSRISNTAFAPSLPFVRDPENAPPAVPSVSALSENVPSVSVAPEKVPSVSVAPSENVPSVAPSDIFTPAISPILKNQPPVSVPLPDNTMPLVLATGDNDSQTVPLCSSEELYELLLSGNINILNEQCKNIEISLVNETANADLKSWNEEVDSIFQLPETEPKKKNVQSKKITKHMLLISDEIFKQKLEEKEKKERMEREKEERKLERQKKARGKAEKNSKKRKTSTCN